MYQQVSIHDFVEAFRQRDRLDTPDSDGGNFTIDGCRALFEYLEDYEEDVWADGDAGLPLDVIALCCEFAEYDSIDDLAGEYDNDDRVAAWLADLESAAQIAEHDDSADGLADDLRAELLDWFRDQTTVIEIPGTDRIIIQQF